MRSEIPKIILAIALPLVGGWISGYLARLEISGWYQNLIQPSFQPPSWLFGPVWTILYTGMGYASYLVWRDGGGFNGAARVPMILYGIQLVLNWAWPLIFFKLHELKWSLVDLLVLTCMIATTGIAFFKVNKIAGFIYIPYFAWCSYASLLNFMIYKLNPEETAPIEPIGESSSKL